MNKESFSERLAKNTCLFCGAPKTVDDKCLYCGSHYLVKEKFQKIVANIPDQIELSPVNINLFETIEYQECNEIEFDTYNNYEIDILKSWFDEFFDVADEFIKRHAKKIIFKYKQYTFVVIGAMPIQIASEYHDSQKSQKIKKISCKMIFEFLYFRKLGLQTKEIML